jgi:ankyrin repeat protein
MNKHFQIAEFLLAHGADVNTNWATHEPASILHECAIHGNFEAARFLIAHGIDLTIKDYRWGGTAAGWALHAAKDQAMYQLLTDAEEERKRANNKSVDESPPE